MFKPHHRQRIRGKGVSRSGAYEVDIRGEIGRRSHTRPAYVVAEAISEALNPASAPGKVTRLADMSPEKQAALRAQYEKRAVRKLVHEAYDEEELQPDGSRRIVRRFR